MTWTSPWDGGDRRVVALGIAAVCAFDAIYLVNALLGGGRSGSGRADAPAWLVGLGDVHVLSLGVVAIAALVAFAAGRRPIAGAALALVAVGVLVEADAARTGGPWRGHFAAGAAMAGALAGSVVARLGRADEPTRLRLLEAGAVGALAATWVGAALGKLGGAGWGWSDASTLRAVVLAHAHVDDPGAIARAIVLSPALARALAVGTIVAQLAAFAWPFGRRTRLWCGAGLVAFHVGVAAATRIGYWQPVALVLLLSLPWPAWFARLRRRAAQTVLDERGARRGLAAVAVVGAVLVLVGLVTPLGAYGRGHHGASTDGAERTVERLGPLARGDALAEGWRVDAIVAQDRRAAVVIVHDGIGRALLWVEPMRPGGSSSPFDVDVARVAHGATAVPIATLDSPAREVARRIAEAAESPDQVARWIVEAR